MGLHWSWRRASACIVIDLIEGACAYRMDKSLTEIQEVIRKKNKDHIPRQRGHYDAFLPNFKRVAKDRCYTLQCPFLAYCEAD